MNLKTNKDDENLVEVSANNNTTNLMNVEHAFVLRTNSSIEKQDFDGPSSPGATIEQVYRIERSGGKLCPEGLGYLAGAAVLTQYRSAKAEVGRHWLPSDTLSFGYSILSNSIPFIALFASGSIDIAIFGGAAEELMRVSPWFRSMAVGSLVFAAGLGLSKKKVTRSTLAALLVTASMGASMLAADNPEFKAHFARMLPESLRAQSYGADKNVAEAKAQAIYAIEKLARDMSTLNHGGVNNQPILGDGYRGNDDQGLLLQNVIIPNDEKELGKAKKAAASASSRKTEVDAESPASWWGQILGAIYLSSWLIGSQLVVANVIDAAASHLRTETKERSKRQVKEIFVRDLESSRGKAAASVGVSDMLHRYRDAMTDACKKNPIDQEVKSRLDQIDALFAGDSIEVAITRGTEFVTNSVHPRCEKFEDDENNRLRANVLEKLTKFRWQRKEQTSGGNAPTL